MPSCFEDGGNFLCDVGIFLRQQLLARLHDCDLTAQAPKQLPEFQPHVARRREPTRCSGTAASSMMEVLSRKGTSFRPSSAGRRGRQPALMKNVIRGERAIAAVFQPDRMDLVPVKAASPKIRSRFLVFSMLLDCRYGRVLTMSRLRRADALHVNGDAGRCEHRKSSPRRAR